MYIMSVEMNNSIPEYLMKGIKFVGHVSHQGKKRMIIVPTKFHDRLDNEFKDNDLTIEINLTFDEDDPEVEK